MIRLVKANFFRLGRSTVFKVCMAFSFLSSIYFVVSKFINIRREPEFYAEIDPMYGSPEMIAFNGGIFLIFVAAVFIALFIGTDHSDGVVRNKLVIGHRRSDVYAANLITAAVVGILIVAVYNGSTFALGLAILPSRCLTAAQIFRFNVCECLAMAALTSILTLLSMLITNRSLSAVTVLMTTLMMLVASAGIYSSVACSTMEDSVMTVDAETGEQVTSVEERDGLTPAQRCVYTFLFDFIPVDQLYQIAMFREDDIGDMMIYSVVQFFAFGCASMIAFRRRDLK